MKILLVTDSFYPNIDGGAIAQYNLVKELAKKGHDIRVIAPGYSFKNYIEKRENALIYRTRAIKLPFYMNGRYFFSPFPLFKVKKIIKEFKPDIINICSPYPISVSSYIWGRKYGIPIIGSIHILPENILSPFSNSKFYNTFKHYAWKYLIYFFNLVDWTTIPTETGAKMYIEKGLKTNITPISNGLETNVFNPNNNGEYLRKKFNLPKENIVLFAGRMAKEKNIEVLIKAIPFVLKKIDAHFLFVGSGGEYKQQMIKLVEKLRVEKHVTFTDFLDWKDYPNIYAIADVFAIPSEAELQSIVTMEAVATGLPVVVADKGALPELASNGNGLVFESANSEQMAECIIKILSDKKLRTDMGKKSLQLIKKHSLESVADQFEKLYKKVIKLHTKNSNSKLETT